jgi:hypothetical protein
MIVRSALLALLFFIMLAGACKSGSQKSQRASRSDCRDFEDGTYVRDMDELGKITVVVQGKTFTSHRVRGVHFIKNEMEWIDDCRFKLTTLEITDPYAKNLDWVGKEVTFDVETANDPNFVFKDLESGDLHPYTRQEK